MAVIEIRGVEHYYEWVCQPKNSFPTGKPVMVFVHGWAGSGRYWRSTAEAMSQQFDCLLYDMRGFGRSRIAPEQAAQIQARGYDLDTFADDLVILLDRLGLHQMYMNAHSMGASVAVFFANKYPERLHKLILTCNGVFEYDEKAFNAFYRFGGYVVKFRPAWLRKIPLMPRMFMARFLHRPIPAAEKVAFLEDFLAADYDTALGTIFTAVSKKATEVMPLEFAQLSVPTLMISGEYDQITPADLGFKAAELNDQIDYVMIAKTSHFPMLEDAETYLRHVNNFLAQPETASQK